MKNFFFKVIFTTVFFLISAYTMSQNNVYLDENGEKISFIDFKKKCGNQLFKCLTYTKDSIALSQVLYKYKFGKISSQEYEQLRKLVIKDAGINIQSDQVIVFKKYDSLFSYEREIELHNKHKKQYQKMKVEVDSLNRLSSKKKEYPYELDDFNKDVFDEIVSQWTIDVNECIDKYEEKFNLKMVFFHMDQPSLEAKYENFSWFKDRGVLQDIFFKYGKLHHTLILKPDGEYFLAGGYFKTYYYKSLLRNEDWSKHKRDYQKTLSREYPDGKGIFRFDYNYHQFKYCF
ncbi:hypothetical protein LX95_02351 [Mesonia algae]|uniref:YARHG domain-containing protein n=1 Tax=Mesonia algae TaxID=213248 RepID=A0A2W7HZ39_9FLAO|nr:hypothetical protein [Mesonia algae]PZW39209.1 hypothetical protein LX95_02351 [Mesonia algae]